MADARNSDSDEAMQCQSVQSGEHTWPIRSICQDVKVKVYKELYNVISAV